MQNNSGKIARFGYSVYIFEDAAAVQQWNKKKHATVKPKPDTLVAVDSDCSRFVANKAKNCVSKLIIGGVVATHCSFHNTHASGVQKLNYLVNYFAVLIIITLTMRQSDLKVYINFFKTCYHNLVPAY